jgi:hypothetical protein
MIARIRVGMVSPGIFIHGIVDWKRADGVCMLLPIGDHVSYTYTLHLPPVPSHTPSLISTLSLIKKKPILDPSTPLAHQLHFVMLSTSNNAQSIVSSGDKAGDETAGDDAGNENTTIGTPYEGLHSLVHFGVTPWFDAYISSKKVGVSLDSAGGKKAGEAQMGKFRMGRCCVVIGTLQD